MFCEPLKFQTLTRETTVVNLQIAAFQHTHISGDTHTGDNFDDIPHNNIFGVDGRQFPLSQHPTLGRYVVLKGSHNGGCILLLLETEEGGDHHQEEEDNPQVQITAATVAWRKEVSNETHHTSSLQ